MQWICVHLCNLGSGFVVHVLLDRMTDAFWLVVCHPNVLGSGIEHFGTAHFGITNDDWFDLPLLVA